MSKWSDDAFLDGLRQAGDPLADAAVTRLLHEGGSKAVARAFRVLQGNHTPLPPDAPVALRTFMEATGDLPVGVDVLSRDMTWPTSGRDPSGATTGPRRKDGRAGGRPRGSADVR